ncbi:MAG: sialate O-acetylesterase [Pirellulales bacterium]
MSRKLFETLTRGAEANFRRRMSIERLEDRMLLTSTPVQVMLLVGQSNMGGYGMNDELRAPYDAPQADVWIWQDDLGANVGWTSLRGGFGGGDTNKGSAGNGSKFGPEVSLGRKLADTMPDAQFALIKHVQAGTAATMQDGWSPDRGDGLGPGQIWIDFVAKTRMALDALTAQQMEYQVAGLFVAQGNRDVGNETGVEAANYERNFAQFISGVRQEFGASQMPVVFGQIVDVGQFDSFDNWSLVRTAQEAVDAADPLATMIGADDLSRISDGVHIDTEGQISHGQRFAYAYLGAPFEGSAKVGSDSFEAGGFAGGYEQWSASGWSTSGDAAIVDINAPHTGANHAQLRSSTGELIRSVDTAGLGNVKLRFWSKLDSLESGDKAWVEVSGDGVSWATLREFVDGEDTNIYRFHEIDVPNLGGTLYVRFDAQMNQSDDYWYIDDVTVVGTTGTVPVPEQSSKFYVVDDASSNQTFEYDESGVPIEDYTLAMGNSAPRGAESTAAGDKTWVIDANKKVYVYDNSGALLGSWTAGSLHSRAQTQGIATNGTDVWIVDSYQDRVFRYTGAAGRLSGSQNAASSFALNTGNRNPKGITTDGAYLWVVNDNSTDKVFKYTLAGSLVGSWTISGGGGSPTGITIDPANVSDVWIIDNASDRVYQFTAAASRTSGSQSAASSFALAAGNTNPQGIADPPAAAAETANGSTTHISASRGRAVTRLDAIDLLFSQDDDSLSRRARRVSGALNAVAAS